MKCALKPRDFVCALRYHRVCAGTTFVKPKGLNKTGKENNLQWLLRSSDLFDEFFAAPAFHPVLSDDEVKALLRKQAQSIIRVR